MTIHSISYGGGIQSTAMLVLAAQGRIEPRVALFCNVGDKAENPATLKYLDVIAKPFAEANGIELVEIQRTGKNPDLYDKLMRPDGAFSGIPVRLSGGTPGRRTCTADYKIEVMAKELKRRGSSVEDPAHNYIGISTDEWMRANRNKHPADQIVEYPLLDLGLSRDDCRRIITDAGLIIPQKSACWFCPYHTKEYWRIQRADHPDVFERACRLEEHMNARLERRGKEPVFMTSGGIPLRNAIPDMEMLDLEIDEKDSQCDSGYCWT